MRRFFRLVDDVHIPKRWHLGEVIANGCSYELWNGNPMEGGKSLQVTLDRPGKPLDFSLTSFAVPVARTRLASAFAPIAGTDLQRLPVVIDGYDEFEVLNSVRIISCLNENESEFTKWTQEDHRPDLIGQYRMITKLKIDPSGITPDAHFFRIEGWRIGLIVSQDVRSAMEMAACFGAVFHAVT